MKILAIASAGGHWIQLLRLQPAFRNQEVVFVSTKMGFENMIKGQAFFLVPDSNRWDKFSLLKSFWHIYKLINIIKPDIIITTGAAPGLIAVITGRCLGIKTVWIDSIANVEELSMSGRIAKVVVTKLYTQWPDLIESDVHYNGNVLS